VIHISNCDCRFSPEAYFTGIRTGASLSLSKNTKNLAGIVLLALRPNGVNIVGAFVKRLSGREGYGLPAVHAPMTTLPSST
jgi:hypothetical protein